MKSMGRLERIVIIISILVIVTGISYGAVKTILQLTEETAPTSDDLVHLWEVTGGNSRKVTVGNAVTKAHGISAWRFIYSNGSAVLTGAALGADGTFLESNGASSAPAFRALLYSDITAFTEANLYTRLSDVSDFLQNLVDETTGHQLGSSLDFNNKVLFDDWTAFTNADTTPNVSAGSFFKTANAGGTTISDFDDTDDHGDFEDGRLLFIWVDDANTTWDFTASELTWASQGANDYAASEDDFFILKFNSGADQWYVVSGPMPSVVSISTFTLPWGDADAALDSGGDIHLNETDEQLGIHSGDSGEISGETAIPIIQTRSWTFDPDAVCDGDVDILMLMEVGIEALEGITIDKWSIAFSQDPATEFGANHLMLKRAEDWIALTNAANMDALDTSSGLASEATDGNINSGAVIPTSYVIYLQFDTAYTATGEQVIFQLWWHLEED